MILHGFVWQKMKPHYTKIALTLIMMASYKDREVTFENGKKLLIRRGQVLTSYNNLSLIASYGLPGPDDPGWAKYLKVAQSDRPVTFNQVKNGIKLLTEGGFCTRSRAMGLTLITVCAYDTYQGAQAGRSPGGVALKAEIVTPYKEIKNINRQTQKKMVLKLNSMLDDSGNS